MDRSHGHPLRKTASFGLFLLQLLLVAAVPYADARLEAETFTDSIHVEAESGAACGLGHHHEFCQVCRAVHLDALPSPEGASDHLVFVAHVLPVQAEESRRPAGSDTLPVGSRAPPRV